ncbi:S1 RNA-binding domain-containing protein [Streptomyces graminifolii]|uniref:S1 RNA-binding domain-containing protein n=1 Tax=Streptomyces graminifolii TaxID=1266771 RepID=UPI0040580CC6
MTKVFPFGVFVEVGAGVEGCVPLRELGAAPGVPPEDVVRVGEEISVSVKEIDRERRRLTLSRRPV